MPIMGNLPSSCWLESPRDSITTKTVGVAFGFFPELEGQTILLKTHDTQTQDLEELR